MGGVSSFSNYTQRVRRYALRSALAISLLLSGCADNRQWGVCGLGGALLGAAAGVPIGIAAGEGPGSWGHDPGNERAIIASVVGAVLTATVGGLGMHYLCDPVIQPPAMILPPAPPPPVLVAKAAPPPIVVKAPPQRIVLRGIHFDFNRYEVRPESAQILDTAAATLSRVPDMRVNLNGYCDEIGSQSYNIVLSQRRAESVRNHLVQAGIAPDRLIPHGYGKSNFVATNDTDEGRAQNRRVELIPTDWNGVYQARIPERRSPEGIGKRAVIGESIRPVAPRRVAGASRRHGVSHRGRDAHRFITTIRRTSRLRVPRRPVLVGIR